MSALTPLALPAPVHAVKPRLCLVFDSVEVEAAVEATCSPSYRVASVPHRSLHDALAEDAAPAASVIPWPAYAVVAEWSFGAASTIGALGRHLRPVGVPLIALCRRPRHEAVAALVAGADKALPLPFPLAQLEAAVLAYLRLLQERPSAGTAPSPHGPCLARGPLRAGPFCLDGRRHRFYVGGEEVALSDRQFALMKLFLRSAGDLLSRARILEEVWGLDFDTGTNLVDVHVHRLRQLLSNHGLDAAIETVRGQGYRLAASEPALSLGDGGA